MHNYCWLTHADHILNDDLLKPNNNYSADRLLPNNYYIADRVLHS